MKIQNICAMLDEEGYKYSSECTKLSGKPPGEKGRKTNCDWVEKYLPEKTLEEDLLKKCKDIINQ